MSRVLTGLLLSSAIAIAGMRKGSLAPSGAAGAVVTGTLTTAFGGYVRAALLVGFFVTSSLLSRLRERRGDSEPGISARSGRRDIVQVAANGGVPTALALMPCDRRTTLAYIGALAAATGDTWATEVGGMASSKPRHVLTGGVVPAGTSGGVSLPGTIASLAGGTCIGTVAAASRTLDRSIAEPGPQLLAAGALAGFAGSLVDSLIGATLQERRWCDTCRQPTERSVHTCGAATRITGGIPGLNNDVVNLLCSLTGAGIGWMLGRPWFQRKAARL